MRSISMLRSCTCALASSLLLIACFQNPATIDDIEPTSSQNDPRETTAESTIDTAAAIEKLKELSARLSPEELEAMRERAKPTQAKLTAWGNRADFFTRQIGAFHPDIDWRNALSGPAAQAEPVWSQGFEEIVIRDFFQDKLNGFFVDLGCAWPYRGSTSCYLEKKLGWTGIAIDALPEYGPLWAKERPNATFVSYAVSDTSGDTVTFYRHDWTGVSSLFKEQSAQRGGEEKLTEIDVETITLNDLLSTHGIEKIDHLTIDIEGAELSALRGFDIERYLPELVCIETRQIAPVLQYFNAHGYELIEKYHKVDKINSYFRRKTSD